MSQEHVEVIRAGFDQLNRRDIDAVLERCDPEVVLTPSLVGGVEKTEFHGRAGYRAWFEQQFETYDEVEFELHDIRAVGDSVVAIYTTRVRARMSGIEFAGPGAAVFTFRDGRVLTQTGYQSPREALAAVGLRE